MARKAWALPTLSWSSSLWTASWTRWTFLNQAHAWASFSSPPRSAQSSPWGATPRRRTSDRLWPACSTWGEALWRAQLYATCSSRASRPRKAPGRTSHASALCSLMGDHRMMFLNGQLKQRTPVHFIFTLVILPCHSDYGLTTCWPGFCSFLSHSGITVYALGVGKAIEQELREIASEPVENHLYYAEDFERMGEMTKRLQSSMCKGAPHISTNCSHKQFGTQDVPASRTGFHIQDVCLVAAALLRSFHRL